MKAKTIAEEIQAEIDDDDFDCLEDKMEKLELLADFTACEEARECPLCYEPGTQGRILDCCTGADLGRCEHCKGVGYLPFS